MSPTEKPTGHKDYIKGIEKKQNREQEQRQKKINEENLRNQIKQQEENRKKEKNSKR